ncbi:hypothetical protein BC938DRAFT_475960 [Jimgerdemannia flammicorona]|uniref:AMP-dependent synthetase/ligase domain-containing protein n=1 Tax=Jimgerdemannia flammicorona TaxID=994334 RepID=A0A433QR42_9FUNG|nr:hypothetical protein BC938DRAFT_475960 [Jimgerdemannia flammicorona]
MNSKNLSIAASALLGSMYLDSRFHIRRDLHQVYVSAHYNFMHWRFTHEDRMNLYFRFADAAKKNPDKVSLVFQGRDYTFRELERHIVAIYMQNSPHFILSWLAIMKLGATPAFINNNLTDIPLLHSLRTSTAHLLLLDPTCAANVEPHANKIKDDLGIEIWSYGATDDPLPFCEPLTERALRMFGEENLSEKMIKGTKQHDIAMLIYTSGTTGLPKSALTCGGICTASAPMIASIASCHYITAPPPWVIHASVADRVVCGSVLFYPILGMLGIAVSWQTGCTVVLGEKFSNSHFWDECRENDVTVLIYIGEICRYLLATPPSPLDKQHKVRLAYGNGLRADIWNQFRDRFGIRMIGEFYASTEGTNSLFNPNNGEFGSGAVGHRGSLIRSLIKDVCIIRVDPITEEPIRAPNGFCIECEYNEPGELLLVNKKDAPLEFQGYYKNSDATNKKIIKNVFKKGDVYFRTGDLLKLDPEGHFIFADRVGDTFRWKSENVSTAEVAEVLGTYPAIQEANVYGVELPGHDGRAGMAAITIKEGQKIDFKELAKFVTAKLPRYAVPVFLRILPAMELTGTFKQRKVELRNEGVDPEKISESDPIYWLTNDGYCPFGRQEWASIVAGKAKL